MAKIISVNWRENWFNIDSIHKKIIDEIKRYDSSHPGLEGLDEVMLDLPGDWKTNPLYRAKGLILEQSRIAEKLEKSGIYILPGDLGLGLTIPQQHSLLKDFMWNITNRNQDARRIACLQEYECQMPELALFEPSLAEYVHANGPASRGVELEKFSPIYPILPQALGPDHTGPLSKLLF